MKENLINLSFSVTGYIVQDIVLITDEPILADEMVRMLNAGDAFTTVHEDNDVIMSDGSVIGTVRWSDTELEFNNFRVEGGNTEEEAPEKKKPFEVSRLARAFAVGEFVSDTDDMDISLILEILATAGDRPPTSIAIEEGSMDKTGHELLYEIEMAERGLKNIMTLAYDAGKNGQEII